MHRGFFVHFFFMYLCSVCLELGNFTQFCCKLKWLRDLGGKKDRIVQWNLQEQWYHQLFNFSWRQIYFCTRSGLCSPVHINCQSFPSTGEDGAATLPCMFLKAAGGDILPPLCLGQAKRRDNCVPWCTRKHLHQFANDYGHGLSFLPRKTACSQQWLLMDPFPLSIYLLSPAIKTALPSLPLKHEPQSATSPHLLNTSGDGGSTASLSSPCQCFTALFLKKFFLISSLIWVFLDDSAVHSFPNWGAYSFQAGIW